MCWPVLQAVGPNTRLGELINSNQRAVVVFYDQWVTPNGYTIGGKVRTDARFLIKTLMQVLLGLGSLKPNIIIILLLILIYYIFIII